MNTFHLLKPCLLAGLFILPLVACQQQQKDQSETGSAAAATGADQKPEETVFAHYTIRPEGIGGYKLGSSPEQVLQQAGKGHAKLVTYQAEGMHFLAIELYERDTLDLNPSVVLQMDCRQQPCIARQILTKDPAFRTPEGVGIGSPFKKLKEHYALQYVGYGEGTLVAVAKNLPLTFELDASMVPEQTLKNVNAATLPDETRVSGIFIYQPVQASEQRPEEQK